MRILPALLLLGFLSACGIQYSLVETERQEIGRTYSVEPQIQWSKQTVRVAVNPRAEETGEDTREFHAYEVWTVNGPQLESLLLFTGVQDGNPLFPRTELEERRFPVFRGTMQASEVLEFVVDSLSRLGNNEVEARNLRPASFGKLPGFRFELSYLSRNGLAFDGMVVGTVSGGVLHMLLFTGARGYYFPKYRDTVERLFDSIEFIGKIAGLPRPHHALRENLQAARL